MKHSSPALTKRYSISFAALAAVVLLVMPQSDSYAQLASRISTTSTNAIVQGDVVWADLVTTDVESAVSFYTQVFGWEGRVGEDPGYVELAHDGNVMCAIARYDDDAEPGNARWLVSISVANVDAVAAILEQQGGSILEVPMEFPDRGRLAVVADNQGAIFMLLRATGGDPPAGPPVIGSLGWAELWTRDVGKAAQFYENVIGYRALRSPAESGQHPAILATQGTPRATIVKIPWDDVEPNWLPYIPVADARGVLHRIEKAGGSVMLTSDDVADDSGSFSAIVADPTGGVFGIQEMEAAR